MSQEVYLVLLGWAFFRRRLAAAAGERLHDAVCFGNRLCRLTGRTIVTSTVGLATAAAIAALAVRAAFRLCWRAGFSLFAVIIRIDHAQRIAVALFVAARDDGGHDFGLAFIFFGHHGILVRAAARVAVLATARITVIARAVSAAAILMLLLLLSAGFRLLRDDALVVLRILEIGFGQNPVAARLCVAAILEVFLQHLLSRAADLYIRANTFKVTVRVVERVLLVVAA